MDTTAAATQAGVTTDTIRTWARMGAIAARKVAGRWVISAASLARRIAIGRKQATPDHTASFLDEVGEQAYDLADMGSVRGLDALLAKVRERDTRYLAGLEPASVRLDEAGWSRVEAMVRFQRGCVIAER